METEAPKNQPTATQFDLPPRAVAMRIFSSGRAAALPRILLATQVHSWQFRFPIVDRRERLPGHGTYSHGRGARLPIGPDSHARLLGARVAGSHDP